MGELKGFQLIVLIVFGACAIAGIAAFALYRSSGSDDGINEVAVWGTLPDDVIDRVVQQYNESTGSRFRITYESFREEAFDQELTEAIAEGRGPDAVIISEQHILRHEAKLLAVPYESYSEQQFRSTFIEAGELFMTPNGIVALPITVDPLVLYWNRTLFADAGIALPPTSWAALPSLIEKLTVRTDTNTITQSTLALGTFDNITNARDIITALLLQSGNEIVDRDPTLGIRSALSVGAPGEAVRPAESALRFYTSLVNPVSELYSWNAALPASREAFLAGDLGMYIGRASELFELQEQNPNLNFDVALLPQADTSARKTYGEVYGVAAVRTTNDVTSAFNAMSVMSDAAFGALIDQRYGLPPVQRSLLNTTPPDAFRTVLYASALIADGFLDPDPDATSDILKAAVSDITSGRKNITTAVQDANQKLERLLES